MSDPGTVCFLRCLSNTHPDIVLPHSQEVVLGRGAETKIVDQRCSRTQLKFVADCREKKVVVTQLGLNPSGCSKDKHIGVGNDVTIYHKETLSFLEGKHQHIIMFDPPPTPGQKRQVEEMPATKKLKPSTDSPSKPSPPAPWLDANLGRLVEGDDGRGGEWREIAGGKMYVRLVNSEAGGEKIAAFDLDWTIIATQSGRVFPKDINDWRIIYPEVPGRLKKLVSEGYKLVFITNQARIASGKLTLAQFQLKLKNILARLGVNPTVFVSASDSGYYRKPRPGIWEWLEVCGNNKVKVAREESFYCGDAAGREAGFAPGKKKDFSCSDRLFAENVGLEFFTPEEFFLGHKATKQFSKPFRPSRSLQQEMFGNPSVEIVPKTPTLTLMVGIQGSGKSFVSRKMERLGTALASNDIHGGREKTLRLVETHLGRGNSVVVDNTHVDREARKPFVDLGKRFRVTIRAFVMETSFEQAKHNNIFREITDSQHARIKDMIFHQYRNRYKEPSEEEGFSEIVKVNCVPEFDNEALEKLYYMYLLEK